MNTVTAQTIIHDNHVPFTEEFNSIRVNPVPYLQSLDTQGMPCGPVYIERTTDDMIADAPTETAQPIPVNPVTTTDVVHIDEHTTVITTTTTIVTH